MNHIAASLAAAASTPVKIEWNCFENCYWNDSLDCDLFPSLGAKERFLCFFCRFLFFFDCGILLVADCMFFFLFGKLMGKKRTCKWKLYEAIRLQLSVGQLYYLVSSSSSLWKIYYICLYWIQSSSALFCQKPPMVSNSVRMGTSLLAGCLAIKVHFYLGMYKKGKPLWSSQAQIGF